MRVLIIDDDHDDIHLFCDAVRRLKFPVDCKGIDDGAEALNALSSDIDQRPDYIFLDVNMPRMNGFEVLAALKNNSALRAIPVIMYTTSKSDEDKLEAYNLGAAHFLTKPDTLVGLREAISHILEGRWQDQR